MRKAQIEVQFNWIFVLIVGAVIMVFFITVVNKQRGAAEITLSSDVLLELEKVIAGVAVSADKTFLVTLPNVPVIYDCDESCACSIQIEGSGAQDIAIRNNPVFAPDSLKGLKVVMWSQEFNAPFRATNFFYMTSPQARYLIEDSARGDYLYDNLPPKKIIEEGIDQPAFTKELFDDLDAIEDLNSYKVKLIFYETTPAVVPSALQSMPNKDVSAIKINEDDKEIVFYEKIGNSFNEKSTTNYIESASLYAAVFSETSDMYECMMEIAFENLNTVSQVYAQRSLQLQEEYDPLNDDECRIYYDPIYLNKMISSTGSGFKNASLGLLNDGIRGLSSQNEGTLLFSCAPIY